jgi:uncharacterized protein (TIGR02145 family)
MLLIFNQRVAICQSSKIDYLKDERVSFKQDANYFSNLSVTLYWELKGARLGAKDEFESQAEYQAKVNRQAQYQAEQNKELLNKLSSIVKTYSDIPINFPKYDAEKQEFSAVSFGFSTADHTINKGFESGKTGPALDFLSSLENTSPYSNQKVANGGVYNSYTCGLWLTAKMPSDKARNMKEEIAPGPETGTNLRLNPPTSSNLLLSIDYIIENNSTLTIRVVGARFVSAKNRKVYFTWGNSKKSIGETEETIFSGNNVSENGQNAQTATVRKDMTSLTDFEGNIYNTITIGTQVWMKENLKTTKYSDGTSIPLVTSTTEWASLTSPGYCWYENDESSYKTPYGALYNWYTVNTGKICPIGWHVPSDTDWTILITYLGGERVAGGKLKEIGTAHWLSPNKGASNNAGFKALPGGCRSTIGKPMDYGIKYYGHWWSSTDNLNEAYMIAIDYSRIVVDLGFLDKTGGYSIRCLKDIF